VALFAYRALTPAGRSCAGVVDADSRTGAWESLRARGIYPTELAEHSATTARAAGRVPAVELAGVTRQLALLIQAGVPVADALDAATEATAHPALLQALTHARAAVREGRPLADAFAESPRVFPALHCDLVRAGEAAGALGSVLARLAAYTETSAALRARLRAALTYPAVMATATTAVLAFLLAWVLPQMAALFADTGAVLPPATRLLMALGGFAAATWWLWLGVALATGVALRTWAHTDDGRRTLDGALLHIPVLGRLLAAAALARVTRTLSTLLASGLRLEHALAMAADAAGNRRVADAVLGAREAVHRGEALAPSLRASSLVPPLVVRLVATGERGGTLPETLDHAASALDAEVERGVAGATALVEPVLVLLMGAAVLLLVLTVLVPILTLDPLGATR
jgi:type II secretory pathway component PulF